MLGIPPYLVAELQPLIDAAHAPHCGPNGCTTVKPGAFREEIWRFHRDDPRRTAWNAAKALNRREQLRKRKTCANCGGNGYCSCDTAPPVAVGEGIVKPLFD